MKSDPRATPRPTLKDVAEMARVDRSLVSRVLNGKTPSGIPEQTVERIQAAAKRIGYRPSAAARGLRTQLHYTIGLVLPDFSSPVYAPIISGAQRVCDAHGYALLLASDPGSDERRLVASLERLVAEDRLDGLIVGSGQASSGLLATLRESRPRPLVLVNRAVEGFVSATVDDFAGAFTATQQLINAGHRHIAHLGGPSGMDTSARRSEGFAAALKAARVRGVPREVQAAGWSALDGYGAARELLTEQPITGVFAANTTLAVGLYRAASELGIRLPKDLSVTALHGSAYASMMVPSLTTIDLPLMELGAAAADMLISQICGESISSKELNTAPIVHMRESVYRVG